MSYLIQSKTRYKSKQTGEEKVSVGYFHKVGKRMPAPHFGSKEGAKEFDTETEARNQLHEIGRSEGERYKIVPNN